MAFLFFREQHAENDNVAFGNDRLGSNAQCLFCSHIRQWEDGEGEGSDSSAVQETRETKQSANLSFPSLFSAASATYCIP